MSSYTSMCDQLNEDSLSGERGNGLNLEDLNILSPEDKIIYQGKKASWGLSSLMEHCPDPHTPLDFACFSHFYQGVYTQFSEMGFRVPKDENCAVERESGCVALSYREPGLSPAMLWKLPRSLMKDLWQDSGEFWPAVVQEMSAWIESQDIEIMNTNDAAQLTKLLKQAMQEYEEFVYKRFCSVGDPDGPLDRKLGRLIKQAVGQENAAEFKERLMRALPFKTALQNQSLLKAAHAAAVYGRDSLLFKYEFEKFLEEFGDRPSAGMGRMISPPTWREKPELIYALIDTLYPDGTPLDPEENFKKQEADLAGVRSAIKEGLKPKEYQKFREVLEKVRNGVIVREEGVFYFEKLAACMHRMALKIGSLLVKQGAVKEAEDVFFIFLEELGPAAKGKLAIKDKIVKRKKAWAKVYAAHEKGVHWLISTGSLPVFAAQQIKKQDTAQSLDSISGCAASRGIYEGPVCIVRNPAEFNKLKKGDILVSPHTAPIWTPLFKVAGAVVTEVGSAGSHAAIVAREYGIPSVVGIDNVTNLWRDGQRIRVDGTNGIVTVLSD